VNIATKLGKIGMGQGASWSIKRISVTMLVAVEPD
jgi:hypothetical protein